MIPLPVRASRHPSALLVPAAMIIACGTGQSAGPQSVRLVDAFEASLVSGTPVVERPGPVVWDFSAGTAPGTNAEAGAGDPRLGAFALDGVKGLAVRDGALVGISTSATPMIALPVPDGAFEDVLHAAELRMRSSEGVLAGIDFQLDEELDREQIVAAASESRLAALSSHVEQGDELATVTLSSGMAAFAGTMRLAPIRYVVLRPADTAGAEFAIESLRLISRKEHLSGVPSGIGWQGLGEIYRETLVTRSPETVRFQVRVPSRPWLELHIGTVEQGPVTFTVAVGDEILASRTVSTPDRWEDLPLDLSAHAGTDAEIVLSSSGGHDGMIAYWGTPVVRQRDDIPNMAAASGAREVLAPGAAPPRGVLFILADTLRRDRLPWYGGERDNAPNLAAIAEGASVFTADVSQGTWTKVSVPAILASLYPSTHGLVDLIDRLPASVTTLEEIYQAAGYATFHTSSVPFTGKLTNLHQGAEVLHESTSVGRVDYSASKTARVFTDRLLTWLDAHQDAPFFAFLHVFDPHSPFEPYAPYQTLYADDEEVAAHRKRLETVREHIASTHMKEDGLPSAEELAKAEIDADAFVNTELDWYDASIKAMDVEIGRIMERLDALGLRDDTLIVFMSDHGEQFLEHGQHFHGHGAYGEMLNVPLMFSWPGVLPAARIDTVVESIDVFPTLLDLSRLTVPAAAQGQSLVPLLARPEAPTGLGWMPRPAFAERAEIPSAPELDGVEQRVIVADGWKLVHNYNLPEGRSEFELYDYLADPLDQNDVAAAHADVVAGLAEELARWHEAALAARVAPDSGEGLSEAERDRLRALGYIQ